MGRRNKSYSKNLHQQAYEKLTGMQAFGESKREAMLDGTAKDKIFSFSTYETYKKHIIISSDGSENIIRSALLLNRHEGMLTNGFNSGWIWLTQKESRLSAWTIQTECAALCKLYQIEKDDPDLSFSTTKKREMRHKKKSYRNRSRQAFQ